MGLIRDHSDTGIDVIFILEQLMGLLGADTAAYSVWMTNEALDPGRMIFTGAAVKSLDKLLTLKRSNLERIVEQERFVHIHPGSPWFDRLAPFMEDNQFFQIALFPYEAKEDLAGYLVLAAKGDKPLWERPYLQVIHELVMLTAEFNMVNESRRQAQQRVREIEKFLDNSLELTSNLNLSDVLTAILRNALQILPQASDAHIFLYDGKVLTFGTALYSDGSVGRIWAMPRENGLTYTVARTAEIILVVDMKDHPLFQNISEDWAGSIIGIPLRYRSRVVGVMTIASLTPHQFDQSELRPLRLLADQAAIAIHNANLHELIKNQALTDSLTSLNNRRSFETEIRRQMDISRRYNLQLTLMILDLDHFKQVNDTYGHPNGDVALRNIAQCLRSNIRKGDFLARIGGDEFAILLPDTGNEAAGRIGDQIRECVRHNDIRLPHGEVVRVSLSYGYAVYPIDAQSISDLVRIADKSLYQFKES